MAHVPNDDEAEEALVLEQDDDDDPEGIVTKQEACRAWKQKIRNLTLNGLISLSNNAEC